MPAETQTLIPEIAADVEKQSKKRKKSKAKKPAAGKQDPTAKPKKKGGRPKGSKNKVGRPKGTRSTNKNSKAIFDNITTIHEVVALLIDLLKDPTCHDLIMTIMEFIKDLRSKSTT